MESSGVARNGPAPLRCSTLARNWCTCRAGAFMLAVWLLAREGQTPMSCNSGLCETNRVNIPVMKNCRPGNLVSAARLHIDAHCRAHPLYCRRYRGRQTKVQTCRQQENHGHLQDPHLRFQGWVVRCATISGSPLVGWPNMRLKSRNTKWPCTTCLGQNGRSSIRKGAEAPRCPASRGSHSEVAKP